MIVCIVLNIFSCDFLALLCDVYCAVKVPVDTFYLGRLGEVAASSSLTKGFNGPLIFIVIILYPFMTRCEINIIIII